MALYLFCGRFLYASTFMYLNCFDISISSSLSIKIRFQFVLKQYYSCIFLFYCLWYDAYLIFNNLWLPYTEFIVTAVTMTRPVRPSIIQKEIYIGLCCYSAIARSTQTRILPFLLWAHKNIYSDSAFQRFQSLSDNTRIICLSSPPVNEARVREIFG